MEAVECYYCATTQSGLDVVSCPASWRVHCWDCHQILKDQKKNKEMKVNPDSAAYQVLLGLFWASTIALGFLVALYV